MSLKQKAINGLTWSFIDNFSKLGINFILGIILARILTPRDFGLIGMISIFIAISGTFVTSGFNTALMRKKECSQTDYSTVFYYNLLVSIVFFLILFISSGTISNFFNEQQLKFIVQALGINIVINAVSIIQLTILIKRVDFKLQTRISVISSVISGIIGITMAYLGFGVWSLVAKILFGSLITTILLWIWNKWRPSFLFSIKSFRKMFSFGYKLLLSGLIDTAYTNAYFLVIGKYFSAIELGYYTRADNFSSLPSQNITQVIHQVSFPILVTLQDDTSKLKLAYKRLIKSTMFISFVLMIGLAVIAKPMVLTLLGEKWLPSVIYLQLLCFAGMLFPLHGLNLNMLNIKGRSDLFLKLEIIKKIIAIPTVVIGVFWGIKVMIIGMIINSLIAYFLNSYYSGKIIKYSIREQVADILPSFFIAVCMGIIVFWVGEFSPFGYIVELIIQTLLGGLLIFVFSELFKIDAYLYIKDIVKTKLIAFSYARK